MFKDLTSFFYLLAWIALLKNSRMSVIIEMLFKWGKFKKEKKNDDKRALFYIETQRLAR